MRHLIILSSYNRPTLVTRAINSVRTQNHGDFELIVTDDNSNEVTVAAIHSAFDHDERCHVVSNTRAREGAMSDPPVRAVTCINDAIQWAQNNLQFDAVHYLPDDDWFADGRLLVFDKFLSVTPAAHVAYGRMLYVENVRGVVDGLYKGRVLTDPSYQVDHGQFCHRASCFDKVNSWPVNAGDYCFDASFFRRLVEFGYLFYPVDATVNFKLRHEKNLTNTRAANVEDRE